jgi:translocation and assembly module TamA
MEINRSPVLLMLTVCWLGHCHALAAQEETRLPAPAASDTAVAGNLAYAVDLEISGPSELAGLLRQTSRLLSQQKEGAVSSSVLNRRIRADIESFEALLRSEGYYALSISRRTVPGNNRYRITLTIDPGVRFSLGTLEVQLGVGNEELAADTKQQTGLRSGDPARSEDIVIAGRVLVQKLASLGYPFAKSSDREVTVDHQTRLVNVMYLLDPGPFVRFGGVRFEGLDEVEIPYLEIFRNWTEGEVYVQDKVDIFRRRLIATGLFLNVSVHPEMPPPHSETSTLLVSVTERPHKTISIGGGYSTNEGFGGDLSWENRNSFGRQERLRFQLSGSQIEQYLAGLFGLPHFKRLDQTLNLDTKFGRKNTDTFDKLALETGASIERKLSRKLKASLGIRLELLSIDEDLGNERFFILGAPFILNWDSSDNPLDPKKGFRVLNTITPSVALLEENFPYLRFENRSTGYFSMRKDQKAVVALRARLGTTVGPAALRLPASERFFSGGGGSVRGLGYQEIGPQAANGDPTGGRSVAEAGVEIRTRVSETIGVVPFVEGGNVYTQTFPQFTGFRWGAGIGLRYYTAFAPLRLDIAVPVNRRPQDSKYQLYISFGQSF